MTMGDEEELTSLLKETNDMTAQELVMILWNGLVESAEEDKTFGLVAFSVGFRTETTITTVKFGVTVLDVSQEQIGKMN